MLNRIMRIERDNLIDIGIKIVVIPLAGVYFSVSWIFKQIGHILELAFGKFKKGIATILSAGALAYILSLIQ